VESTLLPDAISLVEIFVEERLVARNTPARGCHSGGECNKCEVKELARCWCGKEEKEIGCGQWMWRRRGTAVFYSTSVDG
jgi:hypothetical protein